MTRTTHSAESGEHSEMDAEHRTVIGIRDLVKEYRIGGETVRALDGVSADLRAGELCSIVGPSGAGKSTLLHLIGALDTPTSGNVSINGRDLAGLGDRELAAIRLREVGFVFQFFNLLPSMSAWENVALPRMFAGGSLGKARKDAVETLDLVGVAHRADHRPAEMSGGQMQRVAIARALIMQPSLLLADEPTGNLDSRTGAAILELLQELAHTPVDDDSAKRRLVVLVTHDDDAAATADHRITVRDGRIEADELTP